jgi:hypothetical protein
LCYNINVVKNYKTKTTRNEEKNMKYVVEFKLKAEAVGTQDAEEFDPHLICRLHELYEVLDVQVNHPEYCMQEIVSIRPATEEDEAMYIHYYC